MTVQPPALKLQEFGKAFQIQIDIFGIAMGGVILMLEGRHI